MSKTSETTLDITPESSPNIAESNMDKKKLKLLKCALKEERDIRAT